MSAQRCPGGGPLSRRELLGLGALALAGCPALIKAAPAPAPAGKESAGVVVLDNCDTEHGGKASYADNLSWIDSAGKLQVRVGGLNICEEIGSPHRIAIDRERRVWVAETVGGRLLQYDFQGKELLSLPDLKPGALAVEPASGTVWVRCSSGRIGAGFLEVYDAKGARLGRHDVQGYDIAYDPKGKAMWLAEQNLVKVSLAGKVLLSRPITNWCAVSIDIDPRNGNVWVATRHHSAKLGRNALLGFDNDGNPRAEIDLTPNSPFRVSVDPRDGVVWVALMRTEVRRYSSDGKLEARYPIKAISLSTDSQGGHVWVATRDEVLKVDRGGKVLRRTAHKGPTSQAWMVGY